MRLYAVFAPPSPAAAGSAPGPLDVAALSTLVLVREGFNWLGFFFSVVWALGGGLWFCALLFAALVALAAGVPEIVGLDPLTRALVLLAYAIFCGVSANDLRRAALHARGYRLIDVIAARDQAEALIRLAQARAEAPSSAAAKPAPAPAAKPVAKVSSSPALDLGPSPGIWS
jgi:hypothetical protein